MKQSQSFFRTAVCLFAMSSLLFNISCSQEDIESPLTGGDVMVSILLPQEAGTRATFGDEDKAVVNTLHWTLFEIADGEDGEERLEPIASDKITEAFADGDATMQQFTLPLVVGRRYCIAFCAMNSANRLVSYEAGRIKMNYENAVSNSLNDDVFTGCTAEIDMTAGGAKSVCVTLTRPLAQLNWGSSDLEEVTVTPYLNSSDINVTINSGLYNGYDIISGEVSGEMASPVEFPTISCSALPNQTFPIDATPKPKLLAMNYLLTGNGPSTINGTLTFSNSLSSEVEANSIPVQPNYRTNVYGMLATNSGDVAVKMTKAFDSGDNKVPIFDDFERRMREALLAGEDIEIPEGSVLDISNMEAIALKDGQTLTIDGALIFGSATQLYLNSDTLSETTPTVNVQGKGTIYLSVNANPIMINKGAKGIFRNVRIECIPNINTVTSGSALYAEGDVELYGVTICTTRFGLAIVGSNFTAEDCIFIKYGNSGAYAVSVRNGGHGSLKNCKSKCTYYHSIRVGVDSSLTIDGGTYSTDRSGFSCIYMEGENPELTILDGEFIGKSYSIEKNSNITGEVLTLKGGKYSFHLKKCSSGYSLPAADGYKVVTLTNDPVFTYKIVEK